MCDLFSVSERAYYAIRRDIITCRILPGALVTESQLIERYRLGKSTIQIILTRLIHDNFIISHPRKGYYVLPVTLQEMEEVFSLRETLEPLAIRLAVGKVDIIQLKKLEENIQLNIEASLYTRINEFMSAYKFFHLTMIEGCGNNHLISILRVLIDRVSRLIILGFNVQQVYPAIDFPHKSIIDALISEDVEQAELNSRTHIESFHASAREKIESTLGREGKLLSTLPRGIFE